MYIYMCTHIYIYIYMFNYISSNALKGPGQHESVISDLKTQNERSNENDLYQTSLGYQSLVLKTSLSDESNADWTGLYSGPFHRDWQTCFGARP